MVNVVRTGPATSSTIIIIDDSQFVHVNDVSSINGMRARKTRLYLPLLFAIIQSHLAHNKKIFLLLRYRRPRTHACDNVVQLTVEAIIARNKTIAIASTNVFAE